jgi:hypothetical protein
LPPTECTTIDAYLADWTEDPGDTKTAFMRIIEILETKNDVSLSFKDRFGICHSLRATRDSQEWRPYFILVDVIDDDPADRWLSVCFYADTIDDPEELGNFVPQGIKNLDGHCFDVEKGWTDELMAYIFDRIEEAHQRTEKL